ncbi:uncharacterized protein MONBRDRAFT_24686 [Monosiga brevicollis MX1]|uniref:Aminotransferase class I/classII large domain-containing protein n=1 Tax=Monosiga brevicollis TaxID=81824 RepID=A9UX62_MONBE|nr:uncharacterized protein MONBRDRAFT_24686 [Monosiga brevicollis MX1]EDQ90334.1 predicted protein [Monosiga brevicollis MX1]|eukprot:XP_001745101.1 hypothetical protein [Monosiga brevicollis MX1]
MSLSTRGQSYLQNPEWFGPLMECIRLSMAPVKRPEDKVLNLAVAENTLCHDEMEAKLQEIRAAQPITRDLFSYYQMEGIQELRSALADHFNRYLYLSQKRPATAEEFIVGNGCGPLIESVVSCLADANDVVLVPAPYYHAFALDLCKRIGCVIAPVAVEMPEGGEPQLTVEAIQTAYDAAQAAGQQVRALIFTNPNNPTATDHRLTWLTDNLGTIFPRETVADAIRFCLDHQLHFVSDEIYAMSTMAGSDKFASAHEVALNDLQAPDGWERLVHVMWGASKDFGLNGLRIGVLHSCNADLRNALASTGMFFSVPAAVPGKLTSLRLKHCLDIQLLFARMLQDKAFVENYVELNRRRIAEAYETVAAFLESEGFTRVLRGEGAMFVYFNARYLQGRPVEEWTLEREREVWVRMLREQRVMLQPGLVFDHAERGWFRLCYTCASTDVIITAIKRALKILKEPPIRRL